ncbi:MAG: zinc ribbon domain-containing protein [Proteobacteria bacterium]|nr:zinc ribbon domain-containing protein [Pseudomonadota bacterium]
MPIFEYLCLGCENEFEELVLSSKVGESGIACPKCQSPRVQKLLSGFHARSRNSGGEARSLSSGGCSSCSSSNCAHCK